MVKKKTRFSNDSNQKIVEIDHASAASTISLFNTAGVKCQDFNATTSTSSLYNTAGVKCLDFNATTGKTTFYQKTGVGTNTNIVLTIDPATPTITNSLLKSSPININMSTLPEHAQKSDIGTGDLFTYHTGGSGNDFDYLCIKN